MINLYREIAILAKERFLFHSEADFQFALAWQIQKSYPKAQIRLEYCPKQFPNMHLDILVELNSRCYPIELKYKTIEANVVAGGESYHLKSHNAQDLGRYDFWVDVKRIEILRAQMKAYEKGFVIMLSNDPLYWKIPKHNRSAVCDHFRIHENSEKGGLLSWQGEPGKGTVKNREAAVSLVGTYRLQWHTYSTLPNEKKGIFKYLILEI